MEDYKFEVGKTYRETTSTYHPVVITVTKRTDKTVGGIISVDGYCGMAKHGMRIRHDGLCCGEYIYTQAAGCKRYFLASTTWEPFIKEIHVL